MAQPVEDKGFSESFRESAGTGFSFASSFKTLASKFKRSAFSDQDILGRRSGYQIVDVTSGQYDVAGNKEQNDKKQDAERRGISAMFEQSSNNTSKGLFGVANDFFTTLMPMINPFSLNK